MCLVEIYGSYGGEKAGIGRGHGILIGPGHDQVIHLERSEIHTKDYQMKQRVCSRRRCGHRNIIGVAANVAPDLETPVNKHQCRAIGQNMLRACRGHPKAEYANKQRNRQ